MSPSPDTTGLARREDPRRAVTAEALVDAGVALLTDRPGEAFRRLFAAQDVAQRAGVSRQTFYRHWPDVNAYVAAVAAKAIEALFSTDIVQPFLESLASQEISGAQILVRHAADTEYLRVLDERTLPPQMLLWGLVGGQLQAGRRPAPGGGRPAPLPPLEDAVATLLRDAYQLLTERLVPFYDEIARGWNRRFNARTDAHAFAVAATALVEGLAVRSLVEPGAVRDHLYADTVLALIEAFTEPLPATDQDLPAPAADRAKPDARRERAARSREAIIDAATFEFEMRGFERTTIADIATAAGVTEPTVFRHFGTKNRVAVHVFGRNVQALRDAIDADLAQHPPLTAVRNHLQRLGALLRSQPGVADALLEAVRAATKAGPPTEPDDPRLVAPLPHVLAPALQAAQDAGEMRRDLAAFEIAATITNLALLRAFTRSTASPEEATTFLLRLVLEGLAPRAEADPPATDDYLA